MAKKSGLIFGLFFSLSFCVIAQTSSLDNTAIAILTGSTDYKASSYTISTLEESLKTESNLPDPQLEGEFLAAPPGESNRWGAELSWGVDWPGVYTARAREAEAKIKTARKSIEADRSVRLFEIKKLLADYIYLSKKLQLLEELNCNNDSIYNLAVNAAKGGEITILDLNKVKLEYANIRTAKASLIYEQRETVKALNQIYGSDCEDLLEGLICDFPNISIPTRDQLYDSVDDNPYLEAAGAETEARIRAGKTVTMEALPSLSVGYKHAFEDGIHFNGATLGISIPVFSSHNRRKAAKAAIKEAEFMEEAVKAQIVSQAGSLLDQLILLHSQVLEIDPLITETDHNTLLLKAYRGGAITLIDYLTERNYFTNAAMELLALKHDEAVTFFDLQKYLISE